MKYLIRLVRPMALMLALVLLLGALGSCSSAGDVVMELGGSKITANMYAFWLGRYKAFFVYYYMNNQESDSMWESTVDDSGTTLNQMFTSYVKENAKTYAAAMYLFDQYKLKLSDEAKADIDLNLAEIVDSAGGKSALNADLAEFAVNYDILKQIYTIEAKVNRLQEYIFSEEGPAPLTAAQSDEYYQNNYARIRHIFISTSSKFVLDEEGNYTYDDEGNAVTDKFTEEELAEQKKKADEVVAKLEAGEDFDALLPLYTEDSATELYPNGYYFTRNSNYVAEVIDAAFAMEIGDWKMVESELGYHIVQRLELEPNGYSAAANEDFFTDFTSNLTVEAFTNFLAPYMEDVIVHEEIADLYSLKSVNANYYY